MQAPRRRVQVRIEIGADSWREAIVGLRRCQERLAEAERNDEKIVSLVSGSSTWGGTMEGDEDTSVTHDSYVEAVEKYLHGEEAM